MRPVRDDASPPPIDEFLDGDRPRFFPPEESLERMRDLFTPADARLDDPDLAPRIVVALWRWCRAAGGAFGRVSDDETLEDALADLEPCPWTGRLRPILSPSQRSLARAGAASLLLDLASAPEGLSLMPPRGDLLRARAWCDAFDAVASDLRMIRAARGPDVARLLTDPRLVQRVAARPSQVLELEEMLIDETREDMVRRGERAACAALSDRLGLTRREALGLCRLARADAMRNGRSSVEEDRAMMIARLEGYIERSRESMNAGDEIRALRELARVQGLTRTEPEDRAAEFLGVVKRVGSRQDAAKLLPAAAEALGADPEDVEERMRDAGDWDEPRRSEVDALETFDTAEAEG